ncbi:hypothetical protein EJB05_29430, partial [Eragrostis curvula]
MGLCLSTRRRPASIWSKLLPEVGGLILRLLPSHADRLSFRAVCRQWRLAAQQDPTTLPPALPWIRLSDRTFRSLPGGELRRFKAHRVRRTTGTAICLHRFLDLNLVCKTIACSPGLSAAMLSGNAAVLFYQPGGASWLISQAPRDDRHWSWLRWYSDIAFHRGKLYGVTKNDELFSHELVHDNCDGGAKVEHVIKEYDPSIDFICYPRYLVVSCDNKLLMVKWRRRCAAINAPTTIQEKCDSMKLEVFEADVEMGRWSEVKDGLDGQTLFVSSKCSRAIRLPSNDHEFEGDHMANQFGRDLHRPSPRLFPTVNCVMGLCLGKQRCPPSPLWSDLPPELSGLILRRLRSHADRLSFGAVCRQWRLAAQQERSSLPPALPWIRLNDRTFQSLPGGELRRFDFKAVDDHHSRGAEIHVGSCSDGWLMYQTVRTVSTSLTSISCLLVNPFTGATIHVPQPLEIDNLIGKMIVCSPGLFAAIHSDSTAVGFFYRPGARRFPSWSVSPPAPCDERGRTKRYSDIAFHRGKLYALTDTDELYSHELIVHGADKVPVASSHAAVEHVIKEHASAMMGGAATSLPRVFEADLEMGRWSEVKGGLDGQTLFVSSECSRAIRLSSNDHGFHGDHVYFLGADFDFFGSCFKSYHYGSYDMRNDRISQVFLNEKRINIKNICSPGCRVPENSVHLVSSGLRIVLEPLALGSLTLTHGRRWKKMNREHLIMAATPRPPNGLYVGYLFN